MKIIKLINDDILIGKAAKGENENQVVVETPYTVKKIDGKALIMPYELDLLAEPMQFIAFNSYNILWIKNLEDFPAIHDQYIAATSGIEV